MFTSVSGTSCLLSGEGRAQAAQRWCERFENAAAPALFPSASHSLAGSGPAMLAAHLNISRSHKMLAPNTADLRLGTEGYWLHIPTGGRASRDRKEAKFLLLYLLSSSEWWKSPLWPHFQPLVHFTSIQAATHIPNPEWEAGEISSAGRQMGERQDGGTDEEHPLHSLGFLLLGPWDLYNAHFTCPSTLCPRLQQRWRWLQAKKSKSIVQCFQRFNLIWFASMWFDSIQLRSHIFSTICVSGSFLSLGDSQMKPSQSRNNFKTLKS